MNPVYIATALFISFLWGTTPFLHKILLKKMNPFSILIFDGLLYFAGLLCVIAYNYDQLIIDAAKLTYRDMGIITIVGLVASLFANFLYLYVLREHESYIISALVYSSPVFTFLIALFLNSEKITGFGVLGISLIVLGVISIMFNDCQYKLEEFLTIK
jgi:drug/metabolite transporter (DMT)-like permease